MADATLDNGQHIKAHGTEIREEQRKRSGWQNEKLNEA